MNPSLQHNVSLQDKNTLRMDVQARYYADVTSVDGLRALLALEPLRTHAVQVLGGGSNVLFSGNFPGVILRMAIKGKEIIAEDTDSVTLKIGAGEDWPALVDYVVEKGWGGIENLALVPGTAGAAPVQNIACYGHNFHESLVSVTAVKKADGMLTTFSVDECRLGYRTSIFKNEMKDRFVIVSVVLKLSKKPVLNTSYQSRYESVTDELATIATPPYTVRDVHDAIIRIRRRKLPHVDEVGTVGSVFKNPLVSWTQFEEVRARVPGIQFYPEKNLSYGQDEKGCGRAQTRVKIPAAWLIEEMGWAGKRIGHCGIWPTQPINLVNYGGATPAEYLSFVRMVQDAVYERYGISLETEVVIF